MSNTTIQNDAPVNVPAKKSHTKRNVIGVLGLGTLALIIGLSAGGGSKPAVSPAPQASTSSPAVQALTLSASAIGANLTGSKLSDGSVITSGSVSGTPVDNGTTETANILFTLNSGAKDSGTVVIADVSGNYVISGITQISAPPAPAMTGAESQAVDSAQSYLSDGQGFSKYGLTQQLTSSAGEGFAPADVAFAINYLHPDWNAQAVDSAQSYMSDGQGFSHAGLMEQLTSTSGEGFTSAQAAYAVAKVGL